MPQVPSRRIGPVRYGAVQTFVGLTAGIGGTGQVGWKLEGKVWTAGW